MERGKVHVVVLAYHGQGHINPMIQFSKRLAAKGIHVTVATTLSNTKAIQSASSSIVFESIYDDCAEGGVAGPGGFRGFLDRFEASGTRNLTQLIRDSERPVKCLVYDANITWASSVASQMGVDRAAFFTQSCAAIASYYPMHCELSEVTPSVPASSLPGLPEIGLPNLPSLGPDTGRYPPIIRYLLQQFDNSENADWVLFNSFDKLEEDVVSWMSKLWPVRTIGPTLPSIYLDNRVEDDDDYGFNIHKPNTDACMKWLDSKETGSVVYVSFGSNANLNTEQTVELAAALKQSNNSFLWVVQPSEESKLPTNFHDENSGKGLIVKWCPQLEVLAHHAVGCFISHCGWNSTMEAISLGVPMVAMPQILDQMTNAHFVEYVWQVGTMPKSDEKGVTRRDEIKRCINEIMEGERGQEIRKNAIRWKVLAKEAIDEGGSSDSYIDEIISHLMVA
ncbi:UDP-glycosyltransferase 74E2-like [Olea europaea var. sylvestris]|uniref:UDP-glycosyltransferase 74E2-like n=1 Tax=Olea europaea var. sylvestris TaxID=158386 RepID=UPI000C1CD605|nr:UDP-glycosyltransferase 74E2-like [Olea europaea var. sylvestris]